MNNLYLSTVVVGEPNQSTNQVFVSHSSDGGNSWKPVAVEPIQHFPASDLYTNMTVAKNGTVYVTWEHCNASGPSAGCKNAQASMLFSKSTDGGNTWSAAALMTTVTNNCSYCTDSFLPNTATKVGVYNYPVIGADNGVGPYAGNLYVAMYSWTGAYLRVQVIRSTNYGNTWSQPVPVVPPSDTHDQFMPWLSVSSSSGSVGVSWLDRRNDPANVNYQAFAAISRDGGLSFQPNVQLTQAFSNPAINGNDWMGDYSGNTWVGSNFVAAWMDSSNGLSMQDVVGGIKLH